MVIRPASPHGWGRAGQKSAVLLPVVLPQKVGAKLIEARAADLAHDEVDLAAEDVERLLNPGEPAGDRAVERRPAEKAELRADEERDQDIGAAPHTAVEHYRHAVGDR